MTNDRFDTPITVKFGPAETEIMLRTARDASEFLLSSWPGKRSERHRAALQACHDATSGEKPPMAARRAFLAAGREAGVLVKGSGGD